MSAAFLGFEGSYAGEAARISDDARLECKICWYVYDPAKGCESWQVPPDTPFSKLPKDWRCPNCDALPAGFMVIDAGTPAPAPLAKPALRAAPAAAPIADDGKPARAMGEALETAFRDLHRGRMRDVPFLNAALQVQAIGFRAYDDPAIGPHFLGVLLTPWFMNLVLVPREKPDPAPAVGTKSLVAFPSGRYEFIWADRPETGPYRACSLFSPVSEFASQLQAVEIGQAVLGALFDPAIREEGTRAGEIRTLREDDLRRQEEAARRAAAPGPRPADQDQVAPAEPAGTPAEDAGAPTDADAARAAPSPDLTASGAPSPSRRALFLPRTPAPEAGA